MEKISFVYEIEIISFYRDISKDAEKKIDISGYSKNDDWLLPIGNNKKVIGRMKDELGGDVCVQKSEQKVRS